MSVECLSGSLSFLARSPMRSNLAKLSVVSVFLKES